jgi:hypothetical protein
LNIGNKMSKVSSASTNSPAGQPLGYRIDEFVRLSGIGRSTTYGYMRAGRLKAIKVGSRTVILAGSARELMETLPPAYPASEQEVA